MTDIDTTDLLERITGCINNAEYDDEADTLSDAFAVIEAQAAEIERLRKTLAKLSNEINIIGSPFHKAQLALDQIVFDTKREVRAALIGKAEQ